MAALLEQRGIFGMYGFQPPQGVEGSRHTAEIALIDGGHVQHVAVFGDLGQQRIARRQGRRELVLAHEPPDAQDFGLDARPGSSVLNRCRHLYTLDTILCENS